MKNSPASQNRTLKVWRLTLGLAMAVMLSPHAAFASPGGTSVLHLMTETDMTATGVDPNAQGKINVTMTRQGRANNQELKITVAKLDPNTAYGLVAFIGDDTNATGIVDLTTDRKGGFSVTFEKKSQGKMNPHNLPLPEMLDSLCNVRELNIVNGDMETVLQGVLSNPDQGRYLVSQSMNNSGFLPAARGTLSIQAGPNSTRFGLAIRGLTPLTRYNIQINGSIIQAVMADKTGYLHLREMPQWMPDVLGIHTVALTYGGENTVVLSADGLGIPCDTTPPTVSSTSPVNLATNAPINSQLTVTFSEAMDPATITGSTFILQQGGTPVTGTVSYTNGTATFSPATSLLTNTYYTATLTTGVTSLSGSALAGDYVWNFTTGASTDLTLPTVSSVIPTNTATGVALNTQLAAIFSKAMNPVTITNTTFTLQQGVTPVAGAVSYVSGTATFAPTLSLLTNATYTATITTGATDLAGNALAANFVWSFTTGSSADTNPPTVVVIAPTNLTTSVAVNQTVNATFSKNMDPATINTNSFTMTGPGAANIAGNVTYVAASQIAAFTPASDLAPDTTYTNTITTGAKDLAGNALTNNVVWIFTTGSQTDTNLMSIPLGAASTFAIIATAAISGGGNQITGDVGLHPGTAQGIAPSEINGTIHVNDQAVIDAQASLLAAYNEAVSRSVNAQTLEGNLGGLTKAPGLYVNGSSSGISGTGANAILTLDAQGDANAVFVFKMASTLVTDSGTSIVLAGGAQAKNVYWQVGSSATLGTTSIFKGNILAFVTITVNSGSKVDGRLFAGAGGDASGAVTVQSSTITVPAP
jgi:hypothetical protein